MKIFYTIQLITFNHVVLSKTFISKKSKNYVITLTEGNLVFFEINLWGIP